MEIWAGLRPYSGAKVEVCTRNSCMASTESSPLVPPLTVSEGRVPPRVCPGSKRNDEPELALTPSTVK